MRVNRLYGVALLLIGVALLVVTFAISLALNASHQPGTQVIGIQFGGAQIPTGTAILLQNMLLVLGIALAIFGAVTVVLGETSGQVRRVKHPKTATCGSCHASIPVDAVHCPYCGAEFE